MLESILGEIGNFILSIVAIVIASKKGKKIKTAKEIEAKEEARKQKRIAKQLKKNKIKPINENLVETNKNVIETIPEQKTMSLKEKIEMYGE